jgi:ubiquitin C-terminal hydrolase
VAGTNPVASIGHNSLAILPEAESDSEDNESDIDTLPDSIVKALARDLRPESLGKQPCATCGRRSQRTQTKRIDGAPEYLRIKINNVQNVFDEDGNVTGIERNDVFVNLDHIIDLTNYQAVALNPAPLKYRLIGAMCHGGTLEYGHWTATVTGPEKVYHINDHRVWEEARAYLKSNPHDGRQVVVVWYVRVHGRPG